MQLYKRLQYWQEKGYQTESAIINGKIRYNLDWEELKSLFPNVALNQELQYGHRITLYATKKKIVIELKKVKQK